MSRNHTVLAIDSGNTLIKWGLNKDGKWLRQDKMSHAQLNLLVKSWNQMPEPSFIIASNVSNTSVKHQLMHFFSNWTKKPLWITSQTNQCGVTNSYTDPLQLGCDRWAALIAAWTIRRQACLVINIGTAMTVDALCDDGVFLGGIILPGPSLMLKALENNTDLLSSRIGEFEYFPKNTLNATYSGTIQSLVGAIERMHKLLSNAAESGKVSCIVSGGGASIILPYINFPVIFIDNLVLEGLVIMANDLLQVNLME